VTIGTDVSIRSGVFAPAAPIFREKEAARFGFVDVFGRVVHVRPILIVHALEAGDSMNRESPDSVLSAVLG
jgi:hypothetical protein